MRARAHDDARDGFEAHTADGHVLRGDVREPPSKRRVGVAVLAHAMMARRTEFERPAGGGLARFLVARGWRTVTFDFRGHGESGEGAAGGATWSYDDLVRYDLPAVVDAARARAKKLPVVVVGHSLGGHVALAAQGTGRIAADAIACIAANIWLHAHEPSTPRWIVKRAVMSGIDAVCRKRGYFPARALRIGSDDEAAAYFAGAFRSARTGRWQSDDGHDDYLASLARVTAPVFQLASAGDRLNCHPDCAARFLAACGGETRFDRIARADDGGTPPGHMEIVTTERATSAWGRMESWMRDVTRPKN
jgi:predicted alpha/beta hydrolase